MENQIPIGVYIRTNFNNDIIEVNSDIFLSSTIGWTFIDSGYGDKYAHAQGHYFEKPLIDNFGNYNYQYIGGKIIYRGI